MDILRRLSGRLFSGFSKVLSNGASAPAGSPPDSRPTGMPAFIGLAMVAASLFFLFLLSNQFYLRFDLSDGGLFSLSGGSKRILSQLKSSVEIKAYFSKDLPPQYSASRSYLKDLLQEYRRAAKGKVRFQFIDPEKDDPTRQEAASQGISPIQFNIIAKEKYEVREGFMGLVLKFEDKKEVLPVVSDAATLEYDITSRILRMVRDKRKIVGLLSSQGALSASRLNPQVREAIERNYELRDVDLNLKKDGGPLPPDLSGLIILGPIEKFSDENLYALDQFLLSGRPAVFGVDVNRLELSSFAALDLHTGLPEFLGSYGIRIKNNFVMDAQCQNVSIQQRQGWISISSILAYPLYELSNDLSKTHPVTRGLDSLTFPFSAPVDSPSRKSGQVEVLARSSNRSWLRSSWAKPGYRNINPVQDFRPTDGDPKGPFPLAVAVEDVFLSYFSKEGANHPLPKGASLEKFLARSSGKSRVIVVGTSRFAGEPLGGAGAVFLLNAIDWLSLDSDLIAIRSKGGIYKPLKEVGPLYKTMVRWGNILGPAILTVAFGMFRFSRRRRALRRRLAAYGPAAGADGKAYAAQNA